MIKKNLLYFGFMLTTVIGLQSCKTPDGATDTKPDDVVQTTDVSFKTFASGYLTGDGGEGLEEGGMIINSQAEWDALMTSMNSVNQTINDQPVDFSENTVFAYFDRIRGSGGYAVKVTSISQMGQAMHVKLMKSAPKGDAIEIMTQPYTIVMVDKTDKGVTFTEN